MTRIVAVLGTLLATLRLTPTNALATAPLLRRAEMNLSCVFTEFLPTEEQYEQGFKQYCHNFVLNGVKLNDKEELVVTMKLKDSSGCFIMWIYKMRWEDYAATGPIEISHDMCVAEFQKFVGEHACTNGMTKVTRNGMHVITIEGRLGSKLLVEQRQRADYKYPNDCEYIK